VKQRSITLPVWCLIVVGLLVIVMAWLGFVFTNSETSDAIGLSGTGRPLHQDWKAYRYDGSLVLHTPDWGTPSQVLEPPSLWGLIAFWWPAALSVGLGFATLLGCLIPQTAGLLRRRIRISGVRITLLRVMVVIGTVGAWLWLGRFDPYTRAAGTLVSGFMLYAGFRRSLLARRAAAALTSPTLLSRAGIAGYLLVLFLSLAWVISILVWDSYQQRLLELTR
jgi:hypothetical protein